MGFDWLTFWSSIFASVAVALLVNWLKVASEKALSKFARFTWKFLKDVYHELRRR